MISKLRNVVNGNNVTRVTNSYNKVRSYVKSELGVLKERKEVISAKQYLKLMGQYLLKKAKSAFRSVNKFLNEHMSEAGKSKKAGLKPLEGEELEKFIHDTEMYDPNSQTYIHANYSVGKKSK